LATADFYNVDQDLLGEKRSKVSLTTPSAPLSAFLAELKNGMSNSLS
jgi:hypothetical protein